MNDSLTVSEALNLGINAHRSGNVQDADRYYTAILKVNPEHPDANHNMGVLANDIGKTSEGLPFFKQAIASNPKVAQFWLSLINAFIKLNNYAEANEWFDNARQYIELNEDFHQLEQKITANMGDLASQSSNKMIEDAINLRDTGKIEEAINLFRKLYDEDKQNAIILSHLSHCHILRDDFKNAQKYLSAATAINPENIMANCVEVRLLLKTDQKQAAMNKARALYEKVPDNVEILGILGACLRLSNKREESLSYLNKALEFNPQYAEVLVNRGIIHLQNNDLSAALEDLELAFKTKPHMSDIWDLLVGLKIRFEQYSDVNLILDKITKIDDKSDKFFYQLALCNQKLGNYDVAIYNYQKAVKINPKHASAYNNLGISFKEKKDLANAFKSYEKAIEVKPDYDLAYKNIGNAHLENGDIKAASKYFKKAIDINPKNIGALINLGNLQRDQKDYRLAMETFKRALQIEPDNAGIYLNIGSTCKKLGDLHEALSNYKKSLELKPDYVDAYINIGNTQVALKQYKESIGSYKKALRNDPNNLYALNNLGRSYYVLKNYSDAISFFKKAIIESPDFFEAHNNLGNALKDSGDLSNALESYVSAYKANSSESAILINIANILSKLSFTTADTSLLDIINDIIDHRTCCRPRAISRAAISLLKFEPQFKKYLQDTNANSENDLASIISYLSTVSVFLKLIKVSPIPDLEIEQFLVSIRSRLLLSMPEIEDFSGLLPFQSALALHCFSNEYVYHQDYNEIRALERLSSFVELQLNEGTQPKPHHILSLASYHSLNEYSWHKLIVPIPELEEVYQRQVQEPQKEELLKKKIPTFHKITDKVSSKVAQQYEENPYPRWVNLALPISPYSVSDIVSQIELKIVNDSVLEIDNPKILVAGCGTGQESIGVASRFKNSEVLAIDLSLKSLGYAKRQSDELGINNIEYMHADLLDLKKIGRSFDIIACCGVLHHMKNPLAGWKILTDCLKPGGLMKIALYSELARANVVTIRDEIKTLELEPNKSDIINFRKTIIESELSQHKSITSSSDFFSFSTIRDLLFHVQEHRFTIPQLSDHLNLLKLEFCGFEFSEIDIFKKIYNGTSDLYDLEKWTEFENSRPEMFGGMYQLWCQKA